MSKTQKPAPEEKKTKADPKRVDGFLIPDHYRRQSVYKNHPVFRATLLVMVLTVFVAILGGYEWYLAASLKKTVEGTQRLEANEGSRLQNQSLLLKNTKEKYKEVEILKRQIRIPATPILDAIEKTIPKEVSVNEVTLLCPPLVNSGGSKRKATIRVTMFIPGEINPNEKAITDWDNKLVAGLLESGLKASRPDWGPQRQFVLEKSRSNPEVRGWTKDMTFTVEIAEENQPSIVMP